jgi:hypothetical protein
MARKSNLQPLALEELTFEREQEHGYIDHPRSPLSPISPRSPRSPFSKFTTKKPQGEQSMPGAELQYPQQAGDLPQSQTVPALNQYSAAPGAEESKERERPTKTGFFSNYKASKSASRLQASDVVRPGTEESMSKDAERPALSGKVSAKEYSRNGMTHSVSPSNSR